MASSASVSSAPKVALEAATAAVADVASRLRNGSLPADFSVSNVRCEAEKRAAVAVSAAKSFGASTTDLVLERKEQLVAVCSSRKQQVEAACSSRKQQLAEVLTTRVQPKACQVTSALFIVVERSVDVLLPGEGEVVCKSELESFSAALPRLSALKTTVMTRSRSRASAVQQSVASLVESPLPWVQRSPRDMFVVARGKTEEGLRFVVVYCEPKVQWVSEKLACSVHAAQVRDMAVRQRQRVEELARSKAEAAKQLVVVAKVNAQEWKVTAVEWSETTVAGWETSRQQWTTSARERTGMAKAAVDSHVETVLLASKDRLAPVVVRYTEEKERLAEGLSSTRDSARVKLQPYASAISPVVHRTAGFAKQSVSKVIGEERTDVWSSTLLSYAPAAVLAC